MARLELLESFGTVTTISYANEIIQNKINQEYRLIPWENGLLSFDIVKTVADQSDIDYLIAFFSGQKGRGFPFRFKDYSDHTTTVGETYKGDMGTYGGVVPASDGTNSQFQICKFYYSVGETVLVARPITAIDERFPVQVYLDGVLQTGNYSINYDTGEIDFTFNPNGFITIACEFEVWVNFDSDELSYQVIGGENTDLYGIDTIKLVEKRLPCERMKVFRSGYETKIDKILALDFTLDRTGGDTFVTKVDKLSSGHSLETPLRATPLKKYNSGERVLNSEDMSYLIALFRVARGSGIPFDLSATETNYRFGNELSYLIENADINNNEPCANLFKVKSFELKQVEEMGTTIDVVGQVATVTNNVIYNNTIYWGFTSANGQATGNMDVYNPVLNGIALNSGGTTPLGMAFSLGGNSYRLATNGTLESKGAIWANTPLSTANFENFSASFQIYSETDANDGCAFIIQGAGTSAIQTANGGTGIGYLGIAPSICIEFDTYRGPHDPSKGHVGISINGNIGSIVTADFPTNTVVQELEFSKRVNAFCWVDYDSTTVSVYMNNINSKPGSPIAQATVRIRDVFYVTETSTTTYDVGNPTSVGVSSYTLVTCYKITRTDGTIVRLTNFDRAIIVNGEDYYRPQEAPSPQSYSFGTAAAVDNTSMGTILSSETITEEDIIGGKYDFAAIEVFVYDYFNNTTVKTLIKGYLGEISTTERNYTAEVRSNKALLQKKNTRVTTRTCPLIFGSTGLNQCGVNLAPYTDNTSVTSVSGQQIFNISSGRPDKFFDNGVIEFTSGENAGIRSDIATFASGQITLWEPLPYVVQNGDTVTVIAGCDKTIQTCANVYNNAINFGGDPYLPGNNYYMAGMSLVR